MLRGREEQVALTLFSGDGRRLMDSACIPITQKQNSVFQTAECRVPAQGEGL